MGYICRIVPEWLAELPWKKIASVSATALVGAFVTAFHLEGDAVTKHQGLAAQDLQIQELMRHAGENCETIAVAADASALVKRCPSDGCRQIWVMGEGVVFSYFVIASSRLPLIQTAMPMAFDLVPAAYAAGRCVEPPVNHGTPDDRERPIEWLESSADGWQRAIWRWADGCALERHYHRPSGQWATNHRWISCVH